MRWYAVCQEDTPDNCRPRPPTTPYYSLKVVARGIGGPTASARCIITLSLLLLCPVPYVVPNHQSRQQTYANTQFDPPKDGKRCQTRPAADRYPTAHFRGAFSQQLSWSGGMDSPPSEHGIVIEA